MLLSLRIKQKDKFTAIVNHINTLPHIQQMKTKLGLNGYVFQQISLKYKQQILDGASQTPTAVIFNYSVHDRYLTFEPKLDRSFIEHRIVFTCN